MLLLGSATSAIVDANVFEEGPIWMEVTNLTYGDHQWNVSVVAMDGMLFVSALPCSLNCDLGISFELKDGFMATFATKSAIIADGLGRAMVMLHEADLPQMARVRDDGVLFEANFSIGLVVGSSITQTPVCVRRAKGAIGTSVETFTRQVAPYVTMQLEQNATQVYARLWAQCTLANASVVYVRYTWGSDTNWRVPTWFDSVSQCPFLELRVPVNDWAVDRGNFTLYVVVQQDQVLARILTQVFFTRHEACRVKIDFYLYTRLLTIKTGQTTYRQRPPAPTSCRH